jgi:class 3 adenylate cyclase
MPTLEHYHDAGATLLKQGAPLAAYDLVAEGLREFPGEVRLRQLLALALARTGASRQANALLQALVDQGQADEETVGMLARTHKDLGAQAADPAARRAHLERAFHWYAEAHRHSGGYWSGINAATLALLLGNDRQARALARQLQQACLDLWQQQPQRADAYWVLATLGESALLLRDLPAAEAWYQAAVRLGGRRIGDLVSTRRNARLILTHEGADTSAIDACFRIPRVGVFAGHLIDRPGRPAPRFPPSLEADVRGDLEERLQRLEIGIGYASAGNGGDILFLETLHAMGAESHVVLPYNREQFLADSVDFIPGADWAARYRAALERAADVITASDQRMPGAAMSYEFGFLLLDGTAAVRAEELDTELVCFAVWDGQGGDGPGGTAASVEHWRRLGRHIEIVDLAALRARHPPAMTGPSPPADLEAPGERPSSGFEAQLVGLLFADVAGFSKLTEEQIPRFVEHYLGRVAQVLSAAPEQPLLTNTWGDGLYFVFRSVRETGQFALRLSEALRNLDCAALGLPDTLSMRIAVHAGPAYACIDPVTGRANYLGAHVALAARIEPITPPGEVYGSGAFVALAKAMQAREFVCAYVGQTPLAKGYGTFPMFVLRPAG